MAISINASGTTWLAPSWETEKILIKGTIAKPVHCLYLPSPSSTLFDRMQTFQTLVKGGGGIEGEREREKGKGQVWRLTKEQFIKRAPAHVCLHHTGVFCALVLAKYSWKFWPGEKILYLVTYLKALHSYCYYNVYGKCMGSLIFRLRFKSTLFYAKSQTS